MVIEVLTNCALRLPTVKLPYGAWGVHCERRGSVSLTTKKAVTKKTPMTPLLSSGIRPLTLAIALIREGATSGGLS